MSNSRGGTARICLQHCVCMCDVWCVCVRTRAHINVVRIPRVEQPVHHELQWLSIVARVSFSSPEQGRKRYATSEEEEEVSGPANSRKMRWPSGSLHSYFSSRFLFSFSLGVRSMRSRAFGQNRKSRAKKNGEQLLFEITVSPSAIRMSAISRVSVGFFSYSILIARIAGTSECIKWPSFCRERCIIGGVTDAI